MDYLGSYYFFSVVTCYKLVISECEMLKLELGPRIFISVHLSLKNWKSAEFVALNRAVFKIRAASHQRRLCMLRITSQYVHDST